VLIPSGTEHTFQVTDSPSRKLNLFTPAAMVGYFDELAIAVQQGRDTGHHFGHRRPVRDGGGGFDPRGLRVKSEARVRDGLGSKVGKRRTCARPVDAGLARSSALPHTWHRRVRPSGLVIASSRSREAPFAEDADAGRSPDVRPGRLVRLCRCRMIRPSGSVRRIRTPGAPAHGSLHPTRITQGWGLPRIRSDANPCRGPSDARPWLHAPWRDRRVLGRQPPACGPALGDGWIPTGPGGRRSPDVANRDHRGMGRGQLVGHQAVEGAASLASTSRAPTGAPRRSATAGAHRDGRLPTSVERPILQAGEPEPSGHVALAQPQALTVSGTRWTMIGSMAQPSQAP
jgi:hypothetical protein